MEDSTDLLPTTVIRMAMVHMMASRIAGRRQIDPSIRRLMRKLRQKAKAKRHQRGRKKKPIRKENGRLILDTSPFTFNKSPDGNRVVINPVTRNKVKIKSLSGHRDMRAYKMYRKHFYRWKMKWTRKFEQLKQTRRASLDILTEMEYIYAG